MIYAVHKQTKEHQVAGPHSRTLRRDYDLVLADADGWIKWPGGECPLPGDQLCEIKLGYDLRSTRRAKPAKVWEWKDTNLIAYRPIIEPLAKQVKECCVGDHVAFPTGRGVIRLEPDVNNVVIVEDYSDGYKRVALSACELIRTDREKWINAATEYFCDDDGAATMEFIYDALKSGELPQP